MIYKFTHRPWHKCRVWKSHGKWMAQCQDRGCTWFKAYFAQEEASRESVIHYLDHERALHYESQGYLNWLWKRNR